VGQNRDWKRGSETILNVEQEYYTCRWGSLFKKYSIRVYTRDIEVEDEKGGKVPAKMIWQLKTAADKSATE
jgi:hypothetical protein